MNIESFEEMLENILIDAAITDAERDFATNGVLLDAQEVLTALRRKYFEKNYSSNF